MLTVMFATHDGQAVLPRMLDSLVRVRPPAGGWAVIAVDNASTDVSAEILNSYRDRLPLTVLAEPVPGKNRALNRALELARGDLYVFCDDDVVVEADWLERWRETADAHLDHDLFVGTTRPLWPGEPPGWPLGPDEVSIIFGTNEHMREGPCSPLCLLGTNMAVRACALDGGVRFNAQIGPDSSRSYPMGSETDLGRRLGQAGRRCWFSEGPRVGHIVRARQLEAASVFLRGYRWGRGQAHMRIGHHYPPELLRRKNRLRSRVYPLLMPFLSREEAWARQWEWSSDQGYEDGWREVQAEPRVWFAGPGPRIASRFRAGRGA